MKRSITKNRGIIVLCVLLILIVYASASRLSFSNERTLVIGVFSDSYWEVQNGYAYRIIEDAIDVYEEKHPDVKVIYETGIVKDDYSEWLAERLIGEGTPDVFFVLGEDLNDLAKAGALMNLDGLLEEDQELNVKDYYEAPLKCGQYNGQQYALPFECAPRLMFVNRTILEKEGIALPGKNWTWGDFYDICRRVTRDTDGDSIPDQFGCVGYGWKEAFDANGVEVFSSDGTTCSLKGDRVKTAILFLDKLNQLTEGCEVSSEDFDMGNVAFQPMSFSEFRAYMPYPLNVKKYSNFEWDCIPMPKGSAGGNVSTLDTLLVGVHAKTPHRSDAWSFAKILSSYGSIQSEIFTYSEGVSVIRSVTESEGTLKNLMEENSVGMDLKTLSDALDYSLVEPRFRKREEAYALLDHAVEEITNGQNISMQQSIWNRKMNAFLEESSKDTRKYR